MKVLKNLSLMVLLALAFAGCRGKSSQLADFNKQLYAPEYASGFKIERADGRQSVLVSVMNPWQGADSVTTRLFISRNGEPVPEGFDGQVLEGDAQRIVAMSSTHIAMLDAIGETARVVGVSGLDYISNPDIQARRDSIGDVGYEGNINYELLLSLDPDLVLLFGVNGASAMESKLKELGIPFMYVGDYLEESPLGKAEWLVALSEVVGKRAKGEKVFADIPIRYNALKQKVSGAAARHPPSVGHRRVAAGRMDDQTAQPPALRRGICRNDGTEYPPFARSAVSLDDAAGRHGNGFLRPDRLHRSCHASRRADALPRGRPPRAPAGNPSLGGGGIASLRYRFQNVHFARKCHYRTAGNPDSRMGGFTQ